MILGAALTLAACGASSGAPASGSGSSAGPGTVKDAAGQPEVTYNGWPLYTFSGDSGPGVAHGQGLTSFGGTWYAVDASGSPVTSTGGSSSGSGGSGSNGSGGSGSGGYGY